MRALFFINFGVEARNFILSGIYNEVKKRKEVVVIKREEVNSPVLQEFEKEYGFKAVNLSPDYFNKINKVDALLTESSKCKLEYDGFGFFNNYVKKRLDTGRVRKLGNPVTFSLLKAANHLNRKTAFYNEKLATFLKENEVDEIYMVGYLSHDLKTIGNTAEILNIKTKVFINSWKDFYNGFYIPFKIDKLYVWNAKMKEDYLHYNRLKNKVYAVGNVNYYRFNKEPFYNMGHYTQKYGIDFSRPVILYTTIHERQYDKELDILLKIAGELEKLPAVPQLVIRRNPFEEDITLDKLKQYGNVFKITDHYWERDTEKDFSIQYLEGEREWNDLLIYSDAIMSIPSATGLEALLHDTPVLNIAFDTNDENPFEITRFLESPYYREMRSMKNVYAFYSMKELIDHIPGLKQHEYENIDKEISLITQHLQPEVAIEHI